MSNISSLVQALKESLPNEPDETIDGLIDVINKLVKGQTEDEIHRVKIAFGSGSSIGDISIRDIAGRDIVTITNNYLDNHGFIDPNDISMTLEEGMAKLTLPINLLEDKTREITSQVMAFSDRIGAITERLSVEQTNSLDEKTRFEIKFTIEAIANDILTYGLTIDAIMEKQESAMTICELVLRRFLSQDFLEYGPPEDMMHELTRVIFSVEEKILRMRRSVTKASAAMQGLVAPKRIFQKSNASVDICQGKLKKLTRLIDEDLQLMWRVSGTIQGYLRALKL